MLDMKAIAWAGLPARDGCGPPAAAARDFDPWLNRLGAFSSTVHSERYSSCPTWCLVDALGMDFKGH